MTEDPRSELERLLERAREEVSCAAGEEELGSLENRLLGRKGALTRLLRAIGSLPPSERGAFGKRANEAKGEIEELLRRRRRELQSRRLEAVRDYDPTTPGIHPPKGHEHPVLRMRRGIEDVFLSMGFLVLDGPEVETEYFNFEALNIPADHPARDMQDTFWLDNGRLLRTHTSAGQVRAMAEFKPPFKAIFPGRVFRYEATDASHEHTFHQVEGLYVDREVSVANLIASMKTLLSEVFGREVKVRLRPGYFPFVEPGFELDISCLVCGGPGCSVCKQSGWVELLPCGLVHPNVLRAGGLDPEEWQGWAFGLGLSRLVMMRYQLGDIRELLGGDIRFLQQFTGTGLE